MESNKKEYLKEIGFGVGGAKAVREFYEPDYSTTLIDGEYSEEQIDEMLDEGGDE